MTVVYAIAILLLLAGSALFSASEIAVTSANRLRLTSAAEEGTPGARTAVKLMDRYEDTLSAILIGNNLCNIGSDALVTMLAVLLLGDRYNALSSVLITGAMTLVIIFFCESAPKIIAKKNANRLSMELSGFLRTLTVLLWPVIFLVRVLIRLLTLPMKGEDHANEPEEAAAELQSIIETVEDEGIIDEDRSELLLSALDFSQTQVMDVMTARVDVEALDVDEDWRALLLDRDDAPFSRIPVYEGSIDNIVGVLYLNRFFRALMDDPDADLRAYLMEPLYVYKTVKLGSVLGQLRRYQQHMAVVTDEYGGTLGVVTLEDVLEELVGEIWDETDEVVPEIVEQPDGTYEVDGDLPISELAELLDLREEALDTASSTAGGWTIEKFGAFPTAGDEVTSGVIRARVLAMDEDGLRVERLLVEKLSGDKR